MQEFLTLHVHPLRGPAAIHVPTLFRLSCKCRRCTDVQDRYTAAEDWCSVQIGLHDTGSWPCGFLPAYQRGVGWQLPMMQHEPRWLTACIADRQPQISWIYTFGVSNGNKSVLFFSDVENVWVRKVRMVVWLIFNMRHVWSKVRDVPPFWDRHIKDGIQFIYSASVSMKVHLTYFFQHFKSTGDQWAVVFSYLLQYCSSPVSYSWGKVHSVHSEWIISRSFGMKLARFQGLINVNVESLNTEPPVS